MKIDIIVSYEQRYVRGHEKDFVPLITGIHLEALTSPHHKVKVSHQQVDEINNNTEADTIKYNV